MTTTDRIDFADGSAVRSDCDFPSLWFAVTPGGQCLSDPDECRRGKPTAKLYVSLDAAVAALKAAGYGREASHAG